MKTTTTYLSILALGLFSITMNACKESITEANITATADEDAAESVASAIGQDNGGSTDQLSDVSEIASSVGLKTNIISDKSSSSLLNADGVDKIYDPVSQKWTVNLTRKKGSDNSVAYANITRVYQYQFLNSSGMPQKDYITNGETASSMLFLLVSGTGVHHTPRVSGVLKSISATWNVTGLNTNVITINGSFSKSGIDSITTRNGVRIIDHSITLTYTNVTGPRGAGKDWYKTTTGNITGAYVGNVTVQNGNSYTEKTINKTIDITLGNGGKPEIKIGGRKFFL